jgi:hypothetical protein
MLLSIGDQAKPGNYRFHSRFDRVVNFEHEGRLLAVVDESIGPGPLNIVLRDLRRSHATASLPPSDSLLQITSRTVWFAGCRYHFTARHRYSSTLDLPPIDLPCFLRNLSTLGELLGEAAPPKSLAFLVDAQRRKHFRAGFERAFADQITFGVHQVFHGHLLQGIRRLKGCGLGLTPAGDDFIAGFLIGLHLFEKLRGQNAQPTTDAVFRAAHGQNIFSNTFLDLARRGLLSGHMKDLLLALVSGSEGSVRRATRKLFTIGETSGADLATGLFLTLQGLLRQPGGQSRNSSREAVFTTAHFATPHS